MTPIVLDSSFLVALLVPNDAWHSQAVTLWEAIKAAGYTGVHFDCVVAETVSVATRRLYEKGLRDDVQLLLDRLHVQTPAKAITWIFPNVPRLYAGILALIQSSSGELNFNDALIALACRERGIPAIASFDAGFDHVAWLKRAAEPGDLPLTNG